MMVVVVGPHVLVLKARCEVSWPPVEHRLAFFITARAQIGRISAVMQEIDSCTVAVEL